MALIYPPTQNGLQKTLAAQLDQGTTASATLNNTTGIQNLKGIFVVDRIDASGVEKDAAVREYISFAGTSGSTVTTLTRGLGGTTDQDHALGAVVEFISDVVQMQSLIDTFLVEHATAGTHSSSLVTSLKASGAVVTTGTSDVTIVTPKALADAGISLTASSTNTLTNKRITKRVTAITSSATPTINTDNCDVVDITALATAITSMTTNLSGTPTNKQLLEFEIKDDGTARAITWGSSFVAGGTSLPTTTVLSKILCVLFQYSTANSLNKWRCIGVQQEA